MNPNLSLNLQTREFCQGRVTTMLVLPNQADNLQLQYQTLPVDTDEPCEAMVPYHFPQTTWLEYPRFRLIIVRVPTSSFCTPPNMMKFVGCYRHKCSIDILPPTIKKIHHAIKIILVRLTSRNQLKHEYRLT